MRTERQEQAWFMERVVSWSNFEKEGFGIWILIINSQALWPRDAFILDMPKANCVLLLLVFIILKQLEVCFRKQGCKSNRTCQKILRSYYHYCCLLYIQCHSVLNAMAIMKVKIPNPGIYNFRRTGKCFSLLNSLTISLKKVMDESGLGVNSVFGSTTLIFSPTSGENLKKKMFWFNDNVNLSPSILLIKNSR